jgi:serine/threonine protein kinase
MPSSSNPQPPFDDLPDLQKLVNRFEQAWQQAERAGHDVDLDAFLPRNGDHLRLPALYQLIGVDLEHRWKRGQKVELESYLYRFSDLGSLGVLPTELILREYRVRHAHGDRPAPEVYRARFPGRYARLLTLIQELPNGSPGSLPTAPSLPSPPPGAPAAQPAAQPAYAAEGNVAIDFDAFPPASGMDDDLINVQPVDYGPATAKQLDPLPAPATISPSNPPTPAPAASVPTIGFPAGSFTPPPTPTAEKILPIGGGYRLMKELGAGTFGEVWKALRILGGTEVAIKIVRCSSVGGEAQQELKALEFVKGLRHPYLVQYQEIAIWENRLCIVMDLADGSLSDRAKEYRAQGLPGIPTDELLQYIGHAAEALDFLHTRNIHHRDIKPANILIVQGYARLADFGLARGVESQATMVDATLGGTPDYMPPEVWHNSLSPSSDQWSLAVTYGELRLNRRLFHSRNVPGLMSEICGGPPDLSPMPEAEKRVMLKALAATTKDRYPSCVEFMRALYEAVYPPPPNLEPGPGQGTTSNSRLWVWAINLVCLVGMIGAVVWYTVGPSITSNAKTEKPDPGNSTGNKTDPNPQPPPPPVPKREIHVENLDLLTMATGKRKSFPLRFHCKGFTGQVRISCPDKDLPATVKIREQIVDADDEEATVEMMVGQETERTSSGSPYRVDLLVEGKDADGNVLASEKATLRFHVVYLPIDFDTEKPDTELVPDGGGFQYYKRIVFTGAGEPPVPFVLIPKKTARDLPAFYIMERKVSLEQFRKFVARNKDKVSKVLPCPWEQVDPNPKCPVFNVTVSEAQAFAEWMHGNLPTIKQWDTAAGYTPEKAGREEGPYKGTWNKARREKARQDKNDIAIGELTAPLPLDDRTRGDVCEKTGCRDMAGNGQEWTRTLWDFTDWIPKGDESPVKRFLLRGREYIDLRPIMYSDMDSKHENFEHFGERKPVLSFRVVVETR